jgi:hypothetical protein
MQITSFSFQALIVQLRCLLCLQAQPLVTEKLKEIYKEKIT